MFLVLGLYVMGQGIIVAIGSPALSCSVMTDDITRPMREYADL